MSPPSHWQTQVADLAHQCRWLVQDTRTATKPRGFVDLVMVRSGRVLWVVLPDAQDLLTADQMAWRDRLLLAGQDWRCWRPKHLPEVQATLAPSPWSNLRLTEDVNVQGRVL